ncbi:hypothetical protein [Clostridium prolinivorans]|uniref:hypothetical protein n=1 Tax=Clostridium prolinivorans TaxID=2769420 RepID=UPI000FD7DA1E|nr:hypothetical protein [Clostridium prolinivorans]
MVNKIYKKIAALTLVCLTFISSTAFASTSLNPSETSNLPKTDTQKSYKREINKEAFDKFLTEIGLTKEDLKKGIESNKTIFDLAKEKGYTEKQVKDILVKHKTDVINKAVQEGKLTKEEAEKMIEKAKEKTANWDGSIKKHKHKNCENIKNNN